jgi:O-antigen/teichoic acid export membrane protein
MTDNPTPPPNQDWRTLRREERQMRREQRWDSNGAWIGGTILILLGVILLARNFGVLLPQNWWALFLLIPAFGSFASAYSMYRSAGQMTAAARGAVVGGLILLLLTFLFLIEFDWGRYWPVILILLGVAVIGGSAWRK